MPGTNKVDYDAIVVGAGLAGIYALFRLRKMGFKTKLIEAGAGVGGVWFWNCYPGARCDVDTEFYQYGFPEIEEIQKEWVWTERFAAQPEIVRYLDFVCKKLDLYKDTQLETRVTSAAYNEKAHNWTVKTDKGDEYTTKFCIMATGPLSDLAKPDFEGIDTFKGQWYQTKKWPKEPVSFEGKRVAIIGTGSTGVQATPVIAQTAKHLYVLQRTPNFSFPNQNRKLTDAEVAEFKKNFKRDRARAIATANGTLMDMSTRSALAVSAEEREAEYQRRTQHGGGSILAAFADLLVNEEANQTAVEFAHRRIKSIVKDPETARKLTPTDHPFGTKRLCLDTGYYETFNRPNVTLVDIRANPIKRITPTGIICGDQEYEVDILVFATGFDAFTGALSRIDFRGKGGLQIRDAWAHAPVTYLGLTVAGFPNMFMVGGPGSPSILANAVVSIEHHVEVIAECMDHMRKSGYGEIEADAKAQDEWLQFVTGMANMTLFPKANSWYMGANIPGKPRYFLPYIGGLHTYKDKLNEVVREGYKGFHLTKGGQQANAA